MKKAAVLFLVLTLFPLVTAAQVLAQETSSITVKGNQLSNGVVVLDIVKSGKAYQLQCNQSAPGCAVLNNGNYQMVELPKNFGMYECRDVEVFAESAGPTGPEKGKRLGEYCLQENK